MNSNEKILDQAIAEGEIYDRGEKGFETYSQGMEKSSVEKVKVLPFIKEGTILEVGCGCGTVLELLSRYKPKSSIYGTDISDTMLRRSKERKYTHNNISIIKADAREQVLKEKSLDTIIFCSVLHEVYSYSNYSLKSVEDAIENAYKMLKPGGRLIIRDGVKPEEKVSYMKFKKEEVEKKFYRFAEEFGPYKIEYKKEEDLVKLKKHDAMEFLSKYIYDENWDIEVREKFGILTKEEYCGMIEKKGFKIIHLESYLIDFLRETYYEKDVELFEKDENDSLTKTEYPDSTMIIIAEKLEGNEKSIMEVLV
ncbi:MAG: methyltransferase domain-containing protein [Nanoarchaeota archaeon]|nr:methyltransferase domain-containing protein [Nanoarchaeota archaeon]